MNSIADRLQIVFRDVLDQDQLVLRRDMTAADVEAWDSLAHIQLVVAIEKEFKVRFKTTEIVELKDVGAMIDLIERKTQAAG
jgi:acyl carrier protein